MPRDVRVAGVSEIPPGSSKRVKLAKGDVAVFNVAGKFVACKDECPHQMVSLTGGSLEGDVMTCPGHAWKFDLGRSGRCVSGDTELSLRMFPVKVVAGEVYVET